MAEEEMMALPKEERKKLLVRTTTLTENKLNKAQRSVLYKALEADTKTAFLQEFINGTHSHNFNVFHVHSPFSPELRS